MHEFLADDPELAALAAERGVELVDLRRPPDDLSVPTGANLTHGATVVLTVGSDCAVGKKTMAIELHLEAQRRGLASVFVPTGQTGIMIEGWGIAVDAVVADFLAGAAERLVVEGASRGDLLWVEGQGALLHPQFSGVTLGLLHGSAPHALVLCHAAGQTEIEGVPGYPIAPLPELVDLYERVGLPVRRRRVAAVALNTSALDEDAAQGGDRRRRTRDGTRRRRPRPLRRRPPRGRGAGGSWTRVDSWYNGRVNDPRVDRLAELVVGYALGLGKGDVLRIDGFDVSAPLALALYRSALRAGAHPYSNIVPTGINELLVAEGSDEQLAFIAPIAVARDRARSTRS